MSLSFHFTRILINAIDKKEAGGKPGTTTGRFEPELVADLSRNGLSQDGLETYFLTYFLFDHDSSISTLASKGLFDRPDRTFFFLGQLVVADEVVRSAAVEDE